MLHRNRCGVTRLRKQVTRVIGEFNRTSTRQIDNGLRGRRGHENRQGRNSHEDRWPRAAGGVHGHVHHSRIRRFGGGDAFALSGTSPKARKARSYCSPSTILYSEPFRQDIKSSIENGVARRGGARVAFMS